jgi:hypothetical protein
MSEFQEQAKNWLRNVVKQNPDKIKAGVEKAGDLIDKQTGGKYAEKVDAVQQKVGTYVDTQSSETPPSQPPSSTESTPEQSRSAGGEATAEQQGGGEASAGEPQASSDEAGSASAESESDPDDEASGQAGTSAPEGSAGTDGVPEAGGGLPGPR